jgi:hypothetical protein
LPDGAPCAAAIASMVTPSAMVRVIGSPPSDVAY